MTPPSIERPLLVMLAVAAIPLTVGLTLQLGELDQRQGERCAVHPAVEPPEAGILPIPIMVPVVADPIGVVEVPSHDPFDGPELPAGAFSFIVELDGPHLVLATEVDPAWIGSDARLETPGRASASLAADALPDELKGLIGKQFDIYDAEGKQGPAWLGQPRIVSQAEGEIAFGVDTFSAWESFEDPQLRVEVEEDVELIGALWDEGRRLVVAPLDTEARGTWARLASLPAPRVLHVEDVPPDVLEEEIPWAWQDPAVLDWTGGFDVYRTALGDGERSDLSDLISGARWSDDAGAGMVSFSVGDPDGYGCEGYSDRVWGALDLIDGHKRAGISGEGPDGVFDIDGDGVLDVLTYEGPEGGRQLLLGDGDGFATARELPPMPFVGCPC